MEFNFLGIQIQVGNIERTNNSDYGLDCYTSHYSDNGKKKVDYKSMETAQKAAIEMEKKTGNDFSPYKCPICEGYHIGKD